MGSSVELFAAIRRDARVDGLSIRELASKHHVHRRTVRQALASAIPPPRKTPTRTSQRLAPFRTAIDDMLRADLDAPTKQRHTARRVLARLVDEHDVVGLSYSTVRDHVAKRRSEILAESGRQLGEALVPQTHLAGAEAEVDFADLWVVLRGIKTKVFLFTLRLSFSGKAVHRAFATQGQEAFLEGHVYAFEQLGGTPLDKIRYDNLKSAVSRVLFGRDRAESQRWIAFRSHYGFDAFYCQPGKEGAHEKGGVEGEGGRFRRTHCVPMPVVDSIEELNELLAAADAKDEHRRNPWLLAGDRTGGLCPGAAARRGSARDAAPASATDRMCEGAGYGFWGGGPDACQVRAKRRSRSPWASSRVPATAPQAAAIGASCPGSTSLVNSSRTPSATSNVPSTMPPRVQRRPNRSSAANPPRIRSRPVSTAEMPSSPMSTPGSTSPESRSRRSSSTAPTIAAMAAARPSRNPGRGRIARAKRSVMSPPVIQNRARKVTRRAVLRLATAMARARVSATSPRSAVGHQYRAIAGSRVAAPDLPCPVCSGGSACVDIKPLVLLPADDAAEPKMGRCGVDGLWHPRRRAVAAAIVRRAQVRAALHHLPWDAESGISGS